MQLIENLRLALSALAANKMRSLLTMLGIIVGISSVIMITTIGTSIEKTLTKTFNQFGTNTFSVYIEPKDYDSYVKPKPEDFISKEMLDELIEEYGDRFMPVIGDGFGTATTRNANGETITLSLGSTIADDESLNFGTPNLRGRVINYRDNKETRHTIYVSDLFVKQYFKDGSDPIGQSIDLTLDSGINVDFVIVGVYELPEFFEKELYSPGVKEIDKVTPATVPHDTMLKLTHREDPPKSYATITWNTEYDVKELEKQLTDFFDEKYASNPNFEPTISSDQSDLKMVSAVINIVTAAISFIAAISLIVGGVGVMNIMLVSITERTKEIGIRKALGAPNKFIRLQFVTEAIMICLIGGIIGIILGITGGLLIGFVAKQIVSTLYPDYIQLIAITIQPSVIAIIISVLFSILTGVVFGYYPANKAAKMDPIDALRYD